MPAAGTETGLFYTDANFDAAMKEYYTDERIWKLTLTDHPFFAALRRKTQFPGRRMPVTLRYGKNPGRSRGFTTAQTNATGQRVEEFLLTRIKDYAIAIVDGETADATASDVGAFLDAATTEVDSTFEAISTTMAQELFRNGTGQVATLASVDTPSAGVVTLTDSADIVHFEVGQHISFYDVSATTLINHPTAGKGDITAVDRDNGTFTVDTTTDIEDAGDYNFTAAAGDGILFEGDGDDNSGAGPLQAVKLMGLDGYLPGSSTPGTLFSLNRNTDVQRFSGITVDGSSTDQETALIDGLTRVARYGGRTTHAFMSYEQLANLNKLLGSKSEYKGEMRVTGEIAFPAIIVNGPKGQVKCVADQNCQPDIAWLLDMNTWCLRSLQKAPRLLARDGNQRLRQSSADGDEWRIGYYGNLECRAPGFNGRLSLAT